MSAGSVIAVVVTTNRPSELGATLQRLADQSRAPDGIIVLDTGSNPETGRIASRYPLARYVQSRKNLGGAGGFAYAFLLALAEGADWVWAMDDDGRPEDGGCLAALLASAAKHAAPVVSPIIIAPENRQRLSFPYRKGFRYRFTRKEAEEIGIIRGFGHFFNGTLFSAAALMRVGLPDIRLFIRGDEMDFMYRVQRAVPGFITDTSVGFVHPSGDSELVSVARGLMHVVVPQDPMKQFYFFRNRGYVFARNRKYGLLLLEFVRYGLYFLVNRRGDCRGYLRFIRMFWRGMRGKFESYQEIGRSG